jgi:hypothetical protein
MAAKKAKRAHKKKPEPKKLTLAEMIQERQKKGGKLPDLQMKHWQLYGR